MKTDTSEKGLESLIVADMTGQRMFATLDIQAAHEMLATYGSWLQGDPADYNREYAVDLVQLKAFLLATQRAAAESLDLDHDSPARQKFLARLQGEIIKRGVIDVLRHGLKHGPLTLDLFLCHAHARQRQSRTAVSGQSVYR